MKLDSKLESWEVVKPLMKSKPALLLGNGASLAVWEKFQYASLFDMACDTSKLLHLSKEDREVFRHLDDTRNFEQVLSSLAVAKRINQICGLETWQISERYENIRNCLFAAVSEIHLPYANLRDEVKQAIRAELGDYKAVFTTNYDLTVYWSYMNDQKPFKDFFWGSGGENVFDPGDAALFDETTVIYYMHGALHLYKGKDNYTYKHVSLDSGASLLELIRKSKEIPLFISEGSSRDKKAAILDNSYLAFAYRRFCENRVPLVVFGQSLNEEYDNHIVEAIQRMRGYGKTTATNVAKFAVAFSVYPGNDVRIVRFKARMMELFHDKQLHFFDSRTHPLGNPGLRVG